MGCFCCENGENNTSAKTEDLEVDNRGCTDILWFVIFAIFCMALVTVASFAYVYGNPKLILSQHDSYGNICGSENTVLDSTLEFSGRNLKNERFLFVMDIEKYTESLKICVKQCPSYEIRTSEDLKRFYRETGTNLCNYDFKFDNYPDPKFPSDSNSMFGPCPKLPVHKSSSFLKICIPSLLKNVTEQSFGSFKQIVGDLYESSSKIVLITLLALFMSLVLVLLMRFVASLISSIIIVLVIVSTIATSVYLWHGYYLAKTVINTEQQKRFFLSEALHNETVMFWAAVLATIITVLIIFSIFLVRQQVGFLAELFKESTKCLKAIPCLFIISIVSFIVLVSYLAFWLYVVVCLSTAQYPVAKDINILPNLQRNQLVPGANSSAIRVSSLANVKKYRSYQFMDLELVPYMWAVLIVALLWLPEFILSCEQMIISGAVAHWYYRERFHNNTNHVSYACCKLVKYHIGSVAKGSFLITLFRIPRIILTYLHEKIKRASNAPGQQTVLYFLKCCMCCFYCFEKFIRYLTHNAYTVVAIDGKNFCTSAATAFNILASHSVDVATINTLGDLILFLCKCLVTATTTGVALFVFKEDGQFRFFSAPILLVAVYSYLIAHCILSLYEMVLDTVYLCMCQNNDFKSNRQQPQQLQNVSPQVQNEEIPINKNVD